VISRFIRLVSLACCAVVVLSFAMFARDQMAGASRQQSELVAGSSSTPAPGASSKPRAQPRRFIDSAARALTSPFSAIVQSSNPWVKHGLPAAFALLAYGLGLGYLARYSRGLS
jgi:hypothetical protein